MIFMLISVCKSILHIVWIDDFMGVILRIQQENEKQRQGGKTDLFSLSDETIVATIMQFFFDGILSAGTVLDVALLFLAKNPDMQEKAYEEIQVWVN